MRRFLVAALALAGCPQPTTCNLAFAGDPSQPVQAELVIDTPSGAGASLVAPNDGDAVGLQPPPQGGFVIYAAARVKNVDPCGVFFQGQLVDATTGAARSDFDKRNGDLEAAPDGSGWYVPRAIASFSTVANVPACPDATGGGVAEAQGLALRVTVTDKGGRTATVQKRIVPTCAMGACHAECECLCGPGYFSGKCANLDGGICER